MKTLSLIDRDFNKGLWIAQMSFIFTRCGGYYINEKEGEIEASFKFAASSGMNLFLRDLPSNDLSLFYNAITRSKFNYINEFNFTQNQEITVCDFNPGIGLACIFIKSSFPNFKIFAINTNSANNTQMEKNLSSNGISNQFIPESFLESKDGGIETSFIQRQQKNLLDIVDILILEAGQVISSLLLFKDFASHLFLISIIIVDNCDDRNKKYLVDFFSCMQERGFRVVQKGESMILHKPDVMNCSSIV